MNHQLVAVALPPHQSLLMRGLQLPVYRLDPAALIYVDQGAIQAVTAAVRRTLHHAEIHRSRLLFAQLAQRIEIAALDHNALIEISRIHLFLRNAIERRAVRQFHPKRIARHEGFAEGDEIAFLRGSVSHVRGNFVERFNTVELDRS